MSARHAKGPWPVAALPGLPLGALLFALLATCLLAGDHAATNRFAHVA
jgi:hypothetical protein